MKCSQPLKLKLDKYSYYKVGTVQGLGYAAVPCGICHNCRVNQRRIWKNRLLLERSKHGDAAFVTLTYDDKHIPDPPHVNKTHLQKYIKRLRYAIEPIKIRYYGVGEYGDRSFRPHYHIAVYGLNPLLNEKVLRSNWHYCDKDIGIDIGELNEKSANYICGYIAKKVLKVKKRHPVDYGKADEFMICSQGIGKDAAIGIAKQLKDCIHWDKKKILKIIKRGKKTYPLGRFLVRKCAEEMNIPEEEFLIQFWANQQLYFNQEGNVTNYRERAKL